MAGTMDAKQFVKRWRGIIAKLGPNENNEQRDTQKFWNDLFENVLGVPSTVIPTYVDYERRVRGRRIDVFVEDHHFLCEQKSVGIDLDKPEIRQKRQETPYQQASWYAQHLPYSIRPRWLMTCNFETFRIYDLDNDVPESGMIEFTLDELPDHLNLLSFLTSDDTSRLHKEQELSVEAGRYVNRIYDALSCCYHHLGDSECEQRSLNVIVTRIIFMLYAEDAGLLQEHQAFGKYCARDSRLLRDRLKGLFTVLDTPESERDEYLDDELAAFPYVNGGLFHDRDVIVPQLGKDVADAIAEASEDFNWRDISGVIFGGVFEGTLNPETRRAGGMHYTSVRNIDRCLNPLFLDDLRGELSRIEGMKVAEKRRGALERFHEKLAGITVADPAMGSGNFLTEAYRQLRSIENRVIEDEIAEDEGKWATPGQRTMSIYFAANQNPIRVTIDHFYGIEINDFAVAVAKTALWITEEQMLRRTQEIMPDYAFEFLPLRSLTNLHCGNALKADWDSIFPRDLDYLVGNPPFVGARNQSAAQKQQVMEVFNGQRNAGNIDYCAAWYMKAARFTLYKRTRCCLVSTNSICQGEQVANIWKPIHDMGIHIDFAHNTFRWSNEAAAGDQAHVFCVIVGFSREATTKRLYVHDTPDSEEHLELPGRINAYLVDGPDVFVYGRKTPICDVPEMGIGNKPIDNGNYLFTDEERDEFISQEPGAERFFRPWLGSREFINGCHRWCLWLGDANWTDLKDLPLCRERIERVRKFRLASKSAGTRRLAETPTRFHVENMPHGTSVVVPQTSSQRRKYIPMGFIGPETLASNAMRLVPDADLYVYGVLQSQFHNAWMRRTTGRLKNDYQYATSVVYNNFVWPSCGEAAKVDVRDCARAVLEARMPYQEQGATLADMYDPDNEAYFPKLISAHRRLDAAVEEAYGVDFKGDEDRIVAHLFELYAERTRGEM
jgi:hypothetical protein